MVLLLFSILSYDACLLLLASAVGTDPLWGMFFPLLNE